MSLAFHSSSLDPLPLPLPRVFSVQLRERQVGTDTPNPQRRNPDSDPSHHSHQLQATLRPNDAHLRHSSLEEYPLAHPLHPYLRLHRQSYRNIRCVPKVSPSLDSRKSLSELMRGDRAATAVNFIRAITPPGAYQNEADIHEGLGANAVRPISPQN